LKLLFEPEKTDISGLLKVLRYPAANGCYGHRSCRYRKAAAGAKSARLKRDFKGARKAFWIEYDFGPAELTLEGTLYQV
jgi:hypothetical protein